MEVADLLTMEDSVGRKGELRIRTFPAGEQELLFCSHCCFYRTV
jgi:hypothetical protein